jgi:hypothetical protein
MTTDVLFSSQANVMLEYTLEDATDLLVKNLEAAKKNLEHVEHDLDFLRQVITLKLVTSIVSLYTCHL